MTARRRAGATGQLERQGRSHEAPDCGAYRLVRRVAPNTWEVEYTATCDGPGRTGTLRFVSPAAYARHF